MVFALAAAKTVSAVAKTVFAAAKIVFAVGKTVRQVRGLPATVVKGWPGPVVSFSVTVQSSPVVDMNYVRKKVGILESYWAS